MSPAKANFGVSNSTVSASLHRHNYAKTLQRGSRPACTLLLREANWSLPLRAAPPALNQLTLRTVNSQHTLTPPSSPLLAAIHISNAEFLFFRNSRICYSIYLRTPPAADLKFGERNNCVSQISGNWVGRYRHTSKAWAHSRNYGIFPSQLWFCPSRPKINRYINIINLNE